MSPTDRAPRLAAMQARFTAALLGEAGDVPPEVTSHNAPRPAKRFHIYRNNVFASLVTAIRTRFPAVERLVGEEFFRAMARIFVEAHPPRSPALFEYGADFPAFIAAFEPARELPYLPDIARLEWLRSEAYHAADAAPIAPSALAEVPADSLDRLRLSLLPSARLFRSDWPAVSIWEANIGDGDAAGLGDNPGSEDALILRPQLDVLVLRLGPGGWAFARSLADRAPLAEAAARAAADNAEFSLPQTLGALLAAGAISGLSLTPEG